MAADKFPVIADAEDLSGTALSKLTQLQPGDTLSPDTLPTMVGDSGSGGTKGVCAAPAAGDAAKVWSGAGTWVAQAEGGIGDVVGPGTSTVGYLPKWADTDGAELGVGVAAPTGAIVGTSDAQTLTNKTLTTPTIADFTGATHTHQNAAGAGTLDAAAIASGTIAPARLGSGSGGATKFLREDSTYQTIPGGGDALTSGSLAQFAATTSAQLASVLSDETGSGSAVFATSPTLVTPALGTPSSAVLTNATGLPVGALVGAVAIANGGTGQTGQTAAFDALSPTTTKGDLVVDNGTNAVRLPVGATTGHVLTVDPAEATGIKWAAAAGGGSGDVTGPVSSTAGNVPTYADTSGDVLDAGFPVSAAAKTVLDDASVSAMVDTLGGASATGSGGLVRATSPSLTTPTLGVATATSVNKVAVTAPATSATLTIADGATLSAPSTASVAGTNTGDVALAGTPDYITISGQTITRGQVDLAADVTGVLPHGNLGTGGGGSTKFLREDSTFQTISGGGDALTSGTLAQFAATTSAQLAGVLSDETGSGAAVFATSPTLVTPALGTPSSATLTNATGLPTAGLVDGAVTFAKMQAVSANVLLGNDAAGTAVEEITCTAAGRALLDDANAAAQLTTLGAAATAGTLAQFAATTSAELAGVISDETGTGVLVLATSPTLVTPVLGVATATSVNKVAVTAPATSATLTIADGATLTASATATVSGTNTGDQTITLTGDVTGTGTGSFAATIAAGAVTDSKLADMSGFAVKAKPTTGTGDPSEVVLGASDLLGRIESGDVQGITVADLAEESTPAAGDFLLGWESGGAIRKFDVGDLPSGDVTGPVSNVDDRIATWDGTGGDTLQDSGTLISDLQAVSAKDAASGYAGLDALAQVPIARQRPLGREKIHYQFRKIPSVPAIDLHGATYDFMADGELDDSPSNGGSWAAVDTGSGGHGGLITPFDVVQTRWSAEIHFEFKTPTSLTGARLWVGLSASFIDDTAPIEDGDVSITNGTFSIASAAFCWDATVHSGSNFWRAHTSNGGGANDGTVTVTAQSIAADTIYGARLVCNPGSNILFYINDTLVATHTTDLPSVSTPLGIGLRVVGSNLVFEWQRIDVIHD